MRRFQRSLVGSTQQQIQSISCHTCSYVGRASLLLHLIKNILAATNGDTPALGRCSSRMLRALAAPQQLHPVISSLLPVLTNSSCLQQVRGAKAQAKKKTRPPTGQQKSKQPAGKKQKQKLDTKPYDEKDQLNQKVIAMLVPPVEVSVQRTPQVQAEMVRRAKEFSSRQMKAHLDWMSDMRVKLRLKKAALQALPPELRKAAQQEDLRPFPLTRHYLYDSPPEAYRD